MHATTTSQGFPNGCVRSITRRGTDVELGGGPPDQTRSSLLAGVSWPAPVNPEVQLSLRPRPRWRRSPRAPGRRREEKADALAYMPRWKRRAGFRPPGNMPLSHRLHFFAIRRGSPELIFAEGYRTSPLLMDFQRTLVIHPGIHGLSVQRASLQRTERRTRHGASRADAERRGRGVGANANPRTAMR